MSLQDLIGYFEPPSEELQHEEKQSKLRSLRNRQSLFQEEVRPQPGRAGSVGAGGVARERGGACRAWRSGGLRGARQEKGPVLCEQDGAAGSSGTRDGLKHYSAKK